ncbi:MAG: hypothetical protein DVB27_12990, partial [Verrucomicrobia bacterium]
MPRPLRIEYAGAIYHVMNRGVRPEAIQRDDEDRATFLHTLGEACGKTGWQLHAWCLMGKHFHLVLETPQANLVAGMGWLLGTFTGRFNRRHRRRGPLFGGRYKAQHIGGRSGACLEHQPGGETRTRGAKGRLRLDGSRAHAGVGQRARRPDESHEVFHDRHGQGRDHRPGGLSEHLESQGPQRPRPLPQLELRHACRSLRHHRLRARPRCRARQLPEPAAGLDGPRARATRLAELADETPRVVRAWQGGSGQLSQRTAAAEIPLPHRRRARGKRPAQLRAALRRVPRTGPPRDEHPPPHRRDRRRPRAHGHVDQGSRRHRQPAREKLRHHAPGHGQDRGLPIAPARRPLDARTLPAQR